MVVWTLVAATLVAYLGSWAYARAAMQALREIPASNGHQAALKMKVTAPATNKRFFIELLIQNKKLPNALREWKPFSRYANRSYYLQRLFIVLLFMNFVIMYLCGNTDWKILLLSVAALSAGLLIEFKMAGRWMN